MKYQAIPDSTIARVLVNLPVARRRHLFAGLVAGCVAGLAALMAYTLSPGGLTGAEAVMLALFIITLPWMVIGFWNALLGLVLLRATRNAAEAVNPALARVLPVAEITTRTAILSCIRNEDTARIHRNLEAMLEGLARAGHEGAFALYVLSDTSWDDVALAEEAMVADLKARWGGAFEITYRRRTENTGFKAGNIRDFCERWGDAHDYALVLDADSFMTARAIARLVRLMQSDANLGIAQSLVVGLPTISAFARVFQFGMRMGMRSYTLGSAWWQADCGPYWGHNALIRLKPFITQCALPDIPGKGALSGPILSHDQVEAVMMRRAGFEVRVVPEEDGSFEENPPDLLEFIRRDLRWCQGNMQYWRLLAMPGLKPVGRMQLALAILMFLGSPAWVGFMTLSAGIMVLADKPLETFDTSRGLVLFSIVMSMVFAPKIATITHILADRTARVSYGGAARVLLSSLGEVVFSMLLAPVMAIAHTVFLAGLPFGRKIGWSAQARDAHAVSMTHAARRLWPQALFGGIGVVWFAAHAMPALLPALPVIIGPLIAVPFAVITANGAVGRAFLACGLWRLPEETAPPMELQALHLDALPPRLRDEALDGIPELAEPVPVKAG
ncbi:glucans biosynthesis glucosyltransferase MdoH [Breoghania sp. L-A4]|uniref:glucans biosynthesis glucosyltransferase MdoH n=1 Tax=Breoghania sp. L-A4 TaxID=2304600 RepID=UPI000E35A8DC|nr:glucans biosynthesis glucosyltransferase MdoH [Breoghania sp. L-A4]AXS39344.1 glucans biosynthesis glucosyltransferase MdoH [Breoghania sp. L-A4]